MKLILVAVVAITFFCTNGFGQTCTFTSSGTWSTRTCNETGAAPAAGDKIVINAGVTVTSNADDVTIHTGNMDIYGTLDIDHNNVRIDGNVVVKNNGVLNVDGKFLIGNSAGCGYTLIIEGGGKVVVPGGTSDKIFICGNELIRGGTTGCTDPPFCSGADGEITGPSGYQESGALPIKLLYFTLKSEGGSINVSWATTMEENFSRFVVQRSVNGLSFIDIGEVAGQRTNVYDIITKYTFTDQAPLVGFNYYRLKAVDLDDTFEYFEVKVAKIDTPKKLSVYPNPSAGNAITFSTNFNPAETDRILILNQLGTVLFDKPVRALPNSAYFEDNLQPGIYFVRYVSNDFEDVVKVSVKH